jgi:hypothetical protein
MVSVNLNIRGWKHIFWVLGGSVMVYLLPLIAIHLLGMTTDIYYLLFLITTLTFLSVYRKKSNLDVKTSIKSGWALGLILAVFFGLGFISYYLTVSADGAGTSRMTVILWRGLAFGFFSGVLLSAFPFVATWRALAGKNPGRLRRVGVVMVASFSVMLMSFSHSVGMIGMDMQKIQKQVKAEFIASLPTLLSGNPLAAPITETFFRVSETVLSDNQQDYTNDNIKTAILDDQSGGTN